MTRGGGKTRLWKMLVLNYKSTSTPNCESMISHFLCKQRQKHKVREFPTLSSRARPLCQNQNRRLRVTIVLMHKRNLSSALAEGEPPSFFWLTTISPHTWWPHRNYSASVCCCCPLFRETPNVTHDAYWWVTGFQAKWRQYSRKQEVCRSVCTSVCVCYWDGTRRRRSGFVGCVLA